MDDDSFEDSFESSSDSETQHDIVPAFTESNDFTRSQVPTSHTTNVPAGIKSIISLQSRLHSQSSPVELENNTIVQQQQLGSVNWYLCIHAHTHTHHNRFFQILNCYINLSTKSTINIIYFHEIDSICSIIKYI